MGEIQALQNRLEGPVIDGQPGRLPASDYHCLREGPVRVRQSSHLGVLMQVTIPLSQLSQA